MTFLHFLNCAILSFMPFAIVYFSSKVSEYSSKPWHLFHAAGRYIISQLVKIFLLAMVLPALGVDAEGFSPLQELLASGINVVDVYFAASALKPAFLANFPSELRVVFVAIGWSGAEAVSKNLLPLINDARGQEFSWHFTELALAANFNFLLNIGFFGCVWMLDRRDADSTMRGFSYFGLAATAMLPSVLKFAKDVLGVTMLPGLGLHLAVAAVVAIGARTLILSYSSSRTSARKTN